MKKVKEKEKKQPFSAKNLRSTLIGTILLSILVGIGGAWYLNGLLSEKVAAANDAAASSQTSTSNLGRAQALQAYVENHQEDIQKAALIVAQTKTYQYQNQIIEDVTAYATTAGVSIVGFDFSQDISAATVDKLTGLKSLTASITLKNPVPYRNYLTFLKHIEQNFPKMQITALSISPDEDNQDSISNTTIGIQVYVQ